MGLYDKQMGKVKLMKNNIFFGGEDVILTVKKEATEKQKDILKKLHQNAMFENWDERDMKKQNNDLFFLGPIEDTQETKKQIDIVQAHNDACTGKDKIMKIARSLQSQKDIK